MNVLRKTSFALCLLLTAIATSGGQAVARKDSTGSGQGNESGTWSAATSKGLTVMGTWTAVPDSATGSVMGTWTLNDGQGRRVAYGGWSAAKSPTQWTGAWRAIVSESKREYSGTWTAGVDLKGGARFVDLFEKAAQEVASGTWRAETESGAWSIRALKRDGRP